MGVNHADSRLHVAVERLANLCPRSAEDKEGLFQYCAHFTGRERRGHSSSIGAAADWVAVLAGAIGEHEGV